MTKTLEERIDEFVTELDKTQSSQATPITPDKINQELNKAQHKELKQAILTPASTLTRTRIISASLMTLTSICAFLMHEDNRTSDALFYGTTLTLSYNIAETLHQKDSLAKTTGGQISFIVSALTAIMPLGKRSANPEVILSIVASYVANQILYWVDVPGLLNNINDWWHQPNDMKKGISALVALLITAPLSVNAMYYLLADMYAGLQEISEEADSSLLKVMINDLKWQVLLMVPTAFALFAFHAKGLQKVWTSLKDACSFAGTQLSPLFSKCGRNSGDGNDISVPMLPSHSEQPPTTQTESHCGWVLPRTIIFIACSALGYFSQKALIEGMAENAAAMDITGFYNNNTKPFQTATNIAEVTRMVLVLPKYFCNALFLLSLNLLPLRTTKHETKLSRGEISSKINPEVINTVVKQHNKTHPDDNQNSFNDSFLQAIGTNLHQESANKTGSFCNKHWYTIVYGAFSLALLGNGLNNFYLCDTFIGGAMNAFSSIFINAFAVLALYDSDVAVQIYNTPYKDEVPHDYDVEEGDPLDEKIEDDLLQHSSYDERDPPEVKSGN